MKKLKYGKIKNPGNTLYAKEFKGMDKIKCLTCKQYLKGFRILKKDDLGLNAIVLAAASPLSIKFTGNPNVTQYTLKCVYCGCVFTVNMEGE